MEGLSTFAAPRSVRNPLKFSQGRLDLFRERSVFRGVRQLLNFCRGFLSPPEGHGIRHGWQRRFQGAWCPE
jgi:hypothetical protein